MRAICASRVFEMTIVLVAAVFLTHKATCAARPAVREQHAPMAQSVEERMTQESPSTPHNVYLILHSVIVRRSRQARHAHACDRLRASTVDALEKKHATQVKVGQDATLRLRWKRSVMVWTMTATAPSMTDCPLERSAPMIMRMVHVQERESVMAPKGGHALGQSQLLRRATPSTTIATAAWMKIF